MKKLLSIISAGAFLFLAASCVTEEQFATINDGDITAPVLNGYELGEENVVINYTPGTFNLSFNQKMPTYHSVILSSVNGKEMNKAISASMDGSVATVSLNTLNRTLQSMGYVEGDKVSMELLLRASVQQTTYDTSILSYKDSEGRVSITDFVVTVPKGSPYTEYVEDSDWSITGALEYYGINWDADLNMWTDKSGNHVAAHVVLKAGDEFKFRKDQGWDVNLGGDFGGLDSEFQVTQGGPNIKVGADGIYDIFVNTESGIAWVSAAYDPYPEYTEASSWSVIGSLYESGWSKDFAMITDGTNHVATGIELLANDEFKFRKDADWGVNLGGDFGGIGSEFSVTQDGPNIIVGVAGTYDIMVNPDAGTAMVAEATGMKASSIIGGDEPEPDKPAVWSLIGTIGGSAWDTDTDMTNTTGDIWVARSVSLTADDEFKIRADHDWGTNYGGPEANSTSTIDPSNPYDVYKPVLGEAFAAGDKNIQVGVEGLYDITFDYAAMTILVEEHVAAYSLIGSINGSSWDKDIIMSEKDGVWTSPVVQIDGAFKIRFDFSWADENTYGVEEGFTSTVGEPFIAVQPGKDISVEPGQYKIQFTPETKEVLIKAVNFPEHLYMIGEEFGNWDWNSDGVVEMTPVLHNPEWGADAEGQFWTVRYFSAGKGFKFNSVREWGGDFWGLTTNDGFTEAGGNCVVAEDGFYMVHIDLKNEKVHVEPARIYGIGEAFGGWDEGMEAALFKADGKTLKVTAASAGKLRMYAASDIATSDWWTREFNIFDGKIVNRLMDELGAVSVNAGQEVVLDFNAGTGEIKGEGEAPALPETMYIIGDAVGGWDWEANGQDMIPVNGKAGQFWAIRYLEAGKGFKFCPVKEWSGDFTGLGEDTGYTVDSGNCFVAENGVYMIYVDTDNKKLCVEKAQVYGIGECFGGWDAKMADALFSEKDGKLVGKTAAAGEIRIYAESSIATSDWWSREFVFFDGKIAYRGNGGDQERVKVEAGKTVTLDFNAGTAVVE